MVSFSKRAQDVWDFSKILPLRNKDKPTDPIQEHRAVKFDLTLSGRRLTFSVYFAFIGCKMRGF